jgi:nucleoid-associated protein EbfC
MDMRQMLEQAQNLTRALQELDARLAAHEIDSSSKDGQVTVRLNGALDVLGLRIAPELQRGDKAVLERTVAEAFRAGLAAIRKHREEQRASLTGGLHLPEF